jgi:quercetin dioxygenase-like cupin family protein
MTTDTTPGLDGWEITNADDTDWVPWGDGALARAKVLGTADGYLIVLVEAQAGYRGSPHIHEFAEFSYVVAGCLRNQGRVLGAGAAYAASAGSIHDEFEALQPSTYITIFRI